MVGTEPSPDAPVVVKLGGSVLIDPALADAFAADVIALRAQGRRLVVVHGGGPQIGSMLGRLGVETEFRDGLRVTDAETLAVARMVLAGQVGRSIVTAINRLDSAAVGLSGEDAGLIVARQRDAALGRVGDVVRVDQRVIDTLLTGGFIPVISTIAAGDDGDGLNVNADTAAIAVAAALGAERLLFLTDVPGVLADIADPGSLIATLDPEQTRALIAEGTIAGGMIPKVEAALAALDGGVGSAHILDGNQPNIVGTALAAAGGTEPIGTRFTAATAATTAPTAVSGAGDETEPHP